jgi:hypothetical protein
VVRLPGLAIVIIEWRIILDFLPDLVNLGPGLLADRAHL